MAVVLGAGRAACEGCWMVRLVAGKVRTMFVFGAPGPTIEHARARGQPTAAALPRVRFRAVMPLNAAQRHKRHAETAAAGALGVAARRPLLAARELLGLVAAGMVGREV